MSFGLNRAEVIGRLGADVTINHLVSGDQVRRQHPRHYQALLPAHSRNYRMSERNHKNFRIMTLVDDEGPGRLDAAPEPGDPVATRDSGCVRRLKGLDGAFGHDPMNSPIRHAHRDSVVTPIRTSAQVVYFCVTVCRNATCLDLKPAQ